jgi:hypothetical protein
MSGPIPELTSYLDVDEKTIWHGAPPKGILFRASDTFFVPFSFLWFGFALFWEASVPGISASSPNPAPVFFPLVGLIFVCIGFYMAIGRFFWDALIRGRTLYALTNRRAIILTRFPRQGLRSVGLSAATEISTEERADGAGNVIFGARTTASIGVGGWPGTGVGNDFTFEQIPDARGVLRAIRQIQSSSK